MPSPYPKIDAKMKRQITNDWAELFPEMKKKTSVSIARIVGPLHMYVGYSLNSSCTDYRIACGYHNLSRAFDFTYSGLNTNFHADYIDPVTGKDAIKFASMHWLKHEREEYRDAARILKAIAPIPLEGPIKLSDVINGYRAYLRKQNFFRIKELEDPPMIAAWANQMPLAKELLDWGYNLFKAAMDEAIKTGDMFQTKGLAGPGWREYTTIRHVEDWYVKMQDVIAHPKVLQETVEAEIVKHKLQKLPRYDLIID